MPRPHSHAPRPVGRHRRFGLAVLATLALLAAACADDDSNGGDDNGGDPPPTTVAPDEADSTTPEDPGEADSDGAEPDDDRAWPSPDWEVVDPAEAGLDVAVLDELAGRAERGGAACLVLVSDGVIVGEWYWLDTGPDDPAEAWSVTKSITAFLVGIAEEQGHLTLDQPASDFVDEWVGTPSEAVTIRQLLANDSGRFHSFESDYVQLASVEEDKTGYAIGLDQQHDPGTHWEYNNAAIQVLEAVLERATGTDVAAFASEHLFEPIGMESTSLTTDPAGNTLVFMGAQMTCRDMARFGLLTLRDGEWMGEQIVPAEFVAEATRPSTDLQPTYGLLWWLEGGDGEEATGAAGQDEVGGGDVVAHNALGLGGQFVSVLPDHDLVMTRLNRTGEATEDAPLVDLLTLAVAATSTSG